MTNIRKKFAVGTICLAGTLAGFVSGYLAGQKTQEISYISLHNEGNCVDDYKVVRVHKPFAEDDLFVSMNGPFYENFERKYFPARESMGNSYSKEFADKRIADITNLSNR